jgi:hypothetical protein
VTLKKKPFVANICFSFCEARSDIHHHHHHHHYHLQAVHLTEHVLYNDINKEYSISLISTLFLIPITYFVFDVSLL